MIEDRFLEVERLIRNYENGFEEELNDLAELKDVSPIELLESLYKEIDYLNSRLVDEDIEIDYEDKNFYSPSFEDALQHDWEQIEEYEEEHYLSVNEKARRDLALNYEGYFDYDEY